MLFKVAQSIVRPTTVWFLSMNIPISMAAAGPLVSLPRFSFPQMGDSHREAHRIFTNHGWASDRWLWHVPLIPLLKRQGQVDLIRVQS